MTDDTKNRERDFRTIPGQHGKVRILLSKRPTKEGESAPAPEEGGYLPPTGAADDLLLSPAGGATVLDLGTHFAGGDSSPFTYAEEAAYVAPVLLDYSGGLLLEDGPLTYHIDESDFARLDAMMLDPSRLGFTRIIGTERRVRRVPNVLALNYLGTLGGVNAQLADASGYVSLLNGAPDNPDWRWAKQDVGGEDWGAAVTAANLAPQTGRYVRKRRRRYVSVALFDPRYYGWMAPTPRIWPTGNPRWKVTGEARYDALALDFTPRFPLRVFGVPSLLWSPERTDVQVTAGTGIGGAGASLRINEFGLHFAGRLPEIPLPGLASAEDFLARFPAMVRTLRVTSKQAATDPAQIITQEYLARRPLSADVLLAEVTSRILALVPGGTARTDLSFSQPPALLTWSSGGAFDGAALPPVGHLAGIVTAGKKTYYVWRTH